MREVSRDDKWEGDTVYTQPENPRDTDPAWPVEDDGEKLSDEDAPVEAPMEDPRLDKETVDDDPFSPENVGVVQTITLLRIYDVMLADFVEKHPKAGQRLMEKHAKGGFFAPPPAFNPDEVEQYGEE